MVLLHLRDSFDVSFNVISMQIEHNSAVAVGKDGSSDLPPFLPPLLLFLSWTLCGCGPSEGYLATRLVSYELLCRTVIRRWIINPPFSKMMYFYHAMKESLHDTNTVSSTVYKCLVHVHLKVCPGWPLFHSDSLHYEVREEEG